LNQEEILKVIRALVDAEVFGVLVVETARGEAVLRPIGGSWGSSICDAVREVAKKHPRCNMRLFMQNADYERYFKGIVPREQVLPYAKFPSELKLALEEIRQELHLPARSEEEHKSCR